MATAALAAVQYAEQAETLSPANAFLAKVSVTGATIILLFVWFVALSRASRTVRLRVGLVGVVLVVLTAAMFRIEGVTGDILPRLRSRWAPHDDQTLAKLETPADSDPVDLTTTTATDYPQYLGPDRLSSPAPTTFDHDWAAHPPKLLWKQPIGAAWSSFAVVGPYRRHPGTARRRRVDHLLRSRHWQTALGSFHARALRRDAGWHRSPGNSHHSRRQGVCPGRAGPPRLPGRRDRQANCGNTTWSPRTTRVRLSGARAARR